MDVAQNYSISIKVWNLVSSALHKVSILDRPMRIEVCETRLNVHLLQISLTDFMTPNMQKYGAQINGYRCLNVELSGRVPNTAPFFFLFFGVVFSILC